MRRDAIAGIFVAFAALVLIGLCHGCGSPYLTALKAGATFRSTAVATEKGLADSCHAKHLACIAAHGAATPAFNVCTDPCVKGLTAWARYTRPAVNTALSLFVAGVQLAKAIKDKTGGKNGTVTGTTPDQGPGHISALRFNGTSDRIVTTTTYLGNVPRTISWWCKSNLNAPNVVFTHSGNMIGAFHLNYGGIFKPILFLGGGTFRYWSDVTSQDDNNWHHWILTINTGVEDSALYCDGVAQTATSTAGTGYGTAWGALVIGMGSVGTYFSGSLADFRVYNYAFSPAQVTAFRALYAPLQIASADWGCPVSAAAEGGVANTELGRTGWRFGSVTPRYWVDTSTIEGKTVKTMRCSVGGHLYRSTQEMGQTPQEAAYGEWEIIYRRSVGQYVLFQPVGNQPTVYSTVGFNGYMLEYGPGNYFTFRRYANGVIASLVFDAAVTVPDGVFHRFRLHRNSTGLWSVKIKGGTWTAWTTLGSGTDNTFTWSSYLVIAPGLGEVSLGDVTGNLGISHSVLTP